MAKNQNEVNTENSSKKENEKKTWMNRLTRIKNKKLKHKATIKFKRFSSLKKNKSKQDIKSSLPQQEKKKPFSSEFMDKLFAENILGHIGSISNPDGDNAARASLSLSQLLDMLAWFEIFGPNGPIIRKYPHIWKSTMKAYFDVRPDIMEDSDSPISFETRAGIEWVKSKVDYFHKLCNQEFLARVSDQSDQYFENIYTSKHSQYRSKKGQIISSLCTDVFTFLSMQLHTIQDHSSPMHLDMLGEAACVIFAQLRSKQILYRDTFLESFDCAVAAANDFVQLSEKCEESTDAIKETLRLHHEKYVDNYGYEAEQNQIEGENNNSMGQNIEDILDDCAAEVLKLYSVDAVFAAQSLHLFIFEPISEKIGPKLFTHEWAEVSTLNQEAQIIVTTLEDFWADLVRNMEKLILPKAMDAIVSATVSFYIRSLLDRANQHKSNVIPYWSDESRTLDRFEKDIDILQDFFLNRYNSIYPASADKAKNSQKNAIEDKFKILRILHELIGVAFGTARPKPKKFGKPNMHKKTHQDYKKRSPVGEATHLILFLHQKIRDEKITQRLVGDVWHLAAPKKEHKIWHHMKNDVEWKALTPIQIKKENLVESKLNLLKKENTAPITQQKPGVLLDLPFMLQNFYDDKKNRREIPKKNTPVTKMKRALTPVPKTSISVN